MRNNGLGYNEFATLQKQVSYIVANNPQGLMRMLTHYGYIQPQTPEEMYRDTIDMIDRGGKKIHEEVLQYLNTGDKYFFSSLGMKVPSQGNSAYHDLDRTLQVTPNLSPLDRLVNASVTGRSDSFMGYQAGRKDSSSNFLILLVFAFIALYLLSK